jgi:hypothetical protein
MKLKKITSVLAVSSALMLNACGGGGAAGPTQNAGYGDVLSISQQNLGVYARVQVLYPVMLQTGKFGAIKGASFSVESAFESANIINSARTFNFNPVAPITTKPNYFKAESVSAYAVEYKTPGQNSETKPAQIVRTASGLIIVPNGVAPRGVVVYFHPTVSAKNQVPSCLSSLGAGNVSSNQPAYCTANAAGNPFGSGLFATLSALYAARGYVVIAPDYVGLGVDYNNVHPFVVYPENNVMSAFNMFPALRQILESAPFNVDSKTRLPLFLTGYSEGAGYAVKASQMAQTTAAGALSAANLQLKITSPQEGAYSLTDQMNFAFENANDGFINCANANNPSYNCGNVDMMKPDQSSVTNEVSAMNNWNIVTSAVAAQYKPLLTSNVLTAAMYYHFHNLDGAYDMAMNHQFWANISVPDVGILSLYQLFSSPYYVENQIAGSIFVNTTKIDGYDPEISPNITLFTPQGNLPIQLPPNHWGTDNAGTKFINAAVARDPQFVSILASGSTYNWHTNSPINFINLNYDSAVTVLNSYQAYSCMRYGVSFPGRGNLVASSAPCTTSASGALIESTIIPNYQMTNNAIQLTPMATTTTVNPLAINKFWTDSSLNSSFGKPFDHSDMMVQGNIAALCTFENSLKDGSNSGICPEL